MIQIQSCSSKLNDEITQKETPHIIDYLLHLTKNLKELIYNSDTNPNKEKILKLKKYIKNLTHFFEIITEKNYISQKEIIYFKSLVMNYVEKVVFQDITF